MGSINLRDRFNPEELELIDRVYAVARTYIEARCPYHDATPDADEQDALRQMIFAVATGTPLEFDALCDGVLVAVGRYRAASLHPAVLQRRALIEPCAPDT